MKKPKLLCTYPDGEPPDYLILCIPVTLIPFIRHLCQWMQDDKTWESREDWKRGYHASAELEAALSGSCMRELIQEIRDLRGVKPAYVSVPVEDRTSDMYRSIEDVVAHINTIIFGVTGGLEHEDNIMMILRGEEEASGTRNIMNEL